MRRVRYGVGMSLDGFIADAGGGTSFLASDPTYDSAPFFASIDTVLMVVSPTKKPCGGDAGVPGLRNYVVSRTLRPESFPEVTMLGQAPNARLPSCEAGMGRTFGSVAAACCFETCWRRIWSTRWNSA